MNFFRFLSIALLALGASRGELLTVASKDGTRIGLECAGSGPTLLFVHGGVGDRTRWTPMFPLLKSKFTTCAMDRRGRGSSGDSPNYSLLKEAEDIVAVVNSRSGPVFVFGLSYGAVAALEAAFLTDRIAKLMLYEPPLQEPVDINLAVAAKVEKLIQQGDLEQAFLTFQTEIVKQSPAEIARMKARPNFAELVASIRVHPRQMRALAAYRFRRPADESDEDPDASAHRRGDPIAIRPEIDRGAERVAARYNAGGAGGTRA